MGKLIKEGEVSYTKGLALSGSGFNAAILLDVEQPEISKIISNTIRIGKNFSILFWFKKAKLIKQIYFLDKL
jgi:hypothetical protein